MYLLYLYLLIDLFYSSFYLFFYLFVYYGRPYISASKKSAMVSHNYALYLCFSSDFYLDVDVRQAEAVKSASESETAKKN